MPLDVLADGMIESLAPAAGQLARLGQAAVILVRRRPAVMGTLLVVALLSSTIALTHPNYQTNDDPSFSLVAAGVGVRDTPDEHLLFMHVWIGWLLKGLYTISPDVPWYALLLYATFALASAAVLSALWHRWRTVTAFSLFFVVFWVILGHFARDLQFTVVAMYCTAAGWLAAGALAVADAQERRSIGLVALLALVMGVSVRSVSFAMASLLCAPALLSCWLAASRAGRRHLAVVGITAVAGAGLLYAINIQYYRADPGWADFYEYNALRASFNDYQVIRYNEGTQAAFDAAGWSRTDYLMIRRWFHADPRTFSKEKLRQIVDTVGVYGTGVWGDRAWHQISEAFVNRYWIGTTLILAWIGTTWGWRRVWPVVVTLATAAGLIVGVITLLKPVPLSVTMATAGVSALVGTFLAAPRRPGLPRRPWRWVLSISMTAAVVGYGAYGVLQEVTQAGARVREQRAFEADVVQLAPRPDALYLAWGKAFPVEQIDPLGSLAFLRGMRMLPLGLQLHTPHVADTMKRFGIDDLYLALATRPDVFLVSTERQNRLYVAYMREKYGIRVVLQPRFQGRTFTVYAVRPA